MTSDDWAGAVMSTVGAALLLNVFGLSRGLADLVSPLKKEARWTMAGAPGTTWQWRMFGSGLLLFGLAVIAFADPA